MFKHWKKLEEYNIIKVIRKLGKTKLYKFNNKNLIAKALVNLEIELVKSNLIKNKKAKKLQKKNFIQELKLFEYS